MRFKSLFSKDYLNWEEYKERINYMELILFFDNITRTNIRSGWLKNGF